MISIDLCRIKFVWLDLDDTLWDFAGNSLDSLETIYKMHGLDRFFSDVDEWKSRYQHHNHALWQLYNTGDVTREFLQRERFMRPLLEAGATNEEACRLTPMLHNDYLDVLGRHSTLVPYARELLECLRGGGYGIGIISNGFKEVQFRKLESAGVADMIDCVVLSDEIEVNKPDRRLFDYAVEKAGTSSVESLIVGDNPATDIAGGAAAGWQTIYFNRDGLGESAPCADAEVTTLREVVMLFQPHVAG